MKTVGVCGCVGIPIIVLSLSSAVTCPLFMLSVRGIVKSTFIQGERACVFNTASNKLNIYNLAQSIKL